MLDQQFTPNWQVFFTKITHYLSNINIGFSPDKIRMSSNPDKSGNHSPPQPTPAQERIEETLRTLQEPLRRLLENWLIRDRSWPTSRNRDSSSQGYRTVAPVGPTPSTSRGSSSSSSTSKRPSDGEQSYHRRQAKRRLTEINGKLAEAEDRLGQAHRGAQCQKRLIAPSSSCQGGSSQIERNPQRVWGTQIPRLSSRDQPARAPRPSTTVQATRCKTAFTCKSSTEEHPSNLS